MSPVCSTAMIREGNILRQNILQCLLSISSRGLTDKFMSPSATWVEEVAPYPRQMPYRHWDQRWNAEKCEDTAGLQPFVGP